VYIKTVYFQQFFGLNTILYHNKKINRNFELYIMVEKIISIIQKENLLFHQLFPDGFHEETIYYLSLYLKGIMNENNLEKKKQVIIVSDYSEAVVSLIVSTIYELVANVEIKRILPMM